MSTFDPTRRELLKLTAATGGAVAAGPLLPGAAPPATAQTANAAPAPLDVTLRVNGCEQRLTLDARTTLLDALREHLHLTGSKKGCGLGQCGACTVLMDGKRFKSCLSLAGLVEGRDITTIEGLLNGFEEHSDFIAVAKALQRVSGWYWVNVYAGTCFTPDVSVQALFAKVLSRFRPWLR